MPIKLYDKKDDIDESLRDAAIETKDGKFAVADDETGSLKSALDSEREKREAAEKLSKRTADELKKLKTKLEAGEHGMSAEQLQKLRDDARAEAEQEFAPTKAEADRLKAENRSLKLDNGVKKVAGEVGFLGERLDDFWKLHGEEFDLTSDGQPMVKGKPGVDVRKHIEGIAQKRKEWVKGTEGDGGGAGGGGGQIKGTAEAKAVLANPTETLRAARAAGATE